MDEVNRKLCNRVVIDVGLCICLYDILEIGKSFILPGDGAAHTKVHFRLLVEAGAGLIGHLHRGRQ